jgi:hypothetical protein
MVTNLNLSLNQNQDLNLEQVLPHLRPPLLSRGLKPEVNLMQSQENEPFATDQAREVAVEEIQERVVVEEPKEQADRT